MKIRPSRRSGLEVSLSKKFYQKSAIQTQQEIQKIESENAVKKEMIQRMAKELQNLQQFLEQGTLAKQIEKQKLNSSIKNSPVSKICKSPNKINKSTNSINIKSNQLTLSPNQKTTYVSQFTRSQSVCKPTIKATSNRNSSASKIRNTKGSWADQTFIESVSKYPCEVKSHQELKASSSKRLKPLKAKKDENYVKYLECRLRQLAKEVRAHNETRLKIQKKTISNSRRS